MSARSCENCGGALPSGSRHRFCPADLNPDCYRERQAAWQGKSRKSKANADCEKYGHEVKVGGTVLPYLVGRCTRCGKDFVRPRHPEDIDVHRRDTWRFPPPLEPMKRPLNKKERAEVARASWSTREVEFERKSRHMQSAAVQHLPKGSVRLEKPAEDWAKDPSNVNDVSNMPGPPNASIYGFTTDAGEAAHRFRIGIRTSPEPVGGDGKNLPKADRRPESYGDPNKVWREPPPGSAALGIAGLTHWRERQAQGVVVDLRPDEISASETEIREAA